MTPNEFREKIKCLIHFAPSNSLSNERILSQGLCTASQIIEANAVNQIVFAKFKRDPKYRQYNSRELNSMVRFKERSSAEESEIMIQDVHDNIKYYILGDQYPLGRAKFLDKCLKNNIQKSEWIAFLNDFFWVFDRNNINKGFASKIAAGGRHAILEISTDALSDEFIETRIRLSQINGGGSNGCFPRDYETYRPPSEWDINNTPKEIGILNGISKELVGELKLKVNNG